MCAMQRFSRCLSKGQWPLMRNARSSRPGTLEINVMPNARSLSFICRLHVHAPTCARAEARPTCACAPTLRFLPRGRDPVVPSSLMHSTRIMRPQLDLQRLYATMSDFQEISTEVQVRRWWTLRSLGSHGWNSSPCTLAIDGVPCDPWGGSKWRGP